MTAPRLRRYICCDCGKKATCDAGHLPKNWSPARKDKDGNDQHRCRTCHKSVQGKHDMWKHRRPYMAQE